MPNGLNEERGDKSDATDLVYEIGPLSIMTDLCWCQNRVTADRRQVVQALTGNPSTGSRSNGSRSNGSRSNGSSSNSSPSNRQPLNRQRPPKTERGPFAVNTCERFSNRLLDF